MGGPDRGPKAGESSAVQNFGFSNLKMACLVDFKSKKSGQSVGHGHCSLPPPVTLPLVCDIKISFANAVLSTS